MDKIVFFIFVIGCSISVGITDRISAGMTLFGVSTVVYGIAFALLQYFEGEE